MEQVKNHTELVDKVLFNQDYFTEGSNGTQYPKQRVKAEYITYTGERLDNNNQYQPYAGDKVKITVSKLANQDGNIIIKQKALTSRNGTPYVRNDEKEIILSTQEFEELVTNANIDYEKKKSS